MRTGDLWTTFPGRLLLHTTAAVLLLFLVVFAAAKVMPVGDLKPFVDIGGEANLPTWWNSSLLLMVAAAAGLACRAAVATGERRAWTLVALATLYLSLDEATQLHEGLATPVREAGIDLPTYAWLLPGAAVAVVGVALLVGAGRRLPRRVAKGLAWALGLYLLGALGFEALSGLAKQDGHGPVFVVCILVEEALEMGAAALAVVVMARHLRSTTSHPR